ncbi:MAG: 30S ribosomal protein S17 [Verrucomicrobia bacterium]|nr:30S ribosomal protein S17 [Verrucomicrobiota bacterium]
MEATATRNSRKSLIGTVTSRSGDKTIKVTYFYKIPHPLYRKEIKRKTVVHVHDEANDCGLGDRVEIMETRPISKLKRWRVTRVIERAPKLDDSIADNAEAEVATKAAEPAKVAEATEVTETTEAPEATES